VPPFLPHRRADDPPAPASTTPQRVPKSPRSLIAARSP
jgi:hypothetical protein